MFGASIVLNQQVSRERFRDYLTEAERDRSSATALATRPRGRHPITSLWATVVSLFRAGHGPDAFGGASQALELQPGQ